MREFYEIHGWQSFMASIAECPVFIRHGSGLTGLECAKLAKAYDVLSYASMKKDESVALESKMKQKT